MSARFSRRRVLAGAVGLAGGAVLGRTVVWRAIGDDDELRRTVPLPVLPSPTAAPPATAVATPEPRSGGTVRPATAASLSFDTFDAVRAGEPSVLEVLGRTHSRLLNWGPPPNHELQPDLAIRWEQPDALTWLFTLAPNARWHDRPPLAGRAVTAGDVAEHFRRGLALGRLGKQPLVQRASDTARIERLDAVEAGTLRIRTSEPDPLVLHALAGRFALIQGPEAVDAFADRWHELDPTTVVGSGPFRFEGRDGGRLRFAAHVEGHAVPSVDNIEVVEVVSMDEYESGAADEYLARDRREAPAFRARFPAAVESARFEDSPVISSFALGAAPWNNPELRPAISGGLEGAALIDRLFGRRGELAGPVAPGIAGALSSSELAAFAGYGPNSASDARAARPRWEAAGGPGLGDVTIDFPSIFDPRYGASGAGIPLLNHVLGGQFKGAIESYPAIARKVAERRYGAGRAAFWFGWGHPCSSRTLPGGSWRPLSRSPALKVTPSTPMQSCEGLPAWALPPSTPTSGGRQRSAAPAAARRRRNAELGSPARRVLPPSVRGRPAAIAQQHLDVLYSYRGA